jgi:hypothetical protein
MAAAPKLFSGGSASRPNYGRTSDADFDGRAI